jgi:uncharacterized membrane protein
MRRFRAVLLVLILVTILPVVAIRGSDFLVSMFGYDVHVTESITVTPQVVDLFMFPGEVEVQEISISNAASVDTPVRVELRVTPNDQGVEAGIEEDIIEVPAGGTYDVIIFVEAGFDARPQTYRVTVEVFRVSD